MRVCRLVFSLNPKPHYCSTVQVWGDFFHHETLKYQPDDSVVTLFLGDLHFGITFHGKLLSLFHCLATAPSSTYLNWQDSCPDSPCMRWPARTLPASHSAMSTLSLQSGPREWASAFFLSILLHFRILWMLFLRREELHKWVVWQQYTWHDRVICLELVYSL